VGIQRRQFISAAAMTAAWAGTLGATRAAHSRSLHILVLGGTRFIGVYMTELATRRGHIVTLFNRGKTNPQLFPKLEKLRGDRDGQLDSLRGRKWDVVIDDSGFVPRQVRLSAALLAPNVRRYLFVSSVSVYASFAAPATEDSPLGRLADESVEKVDATTYGALKALCEAAAAEALPGRATILRPGYIVGPGDNSDRFTYWPARAARGGDMLAPGSPGDPIQFVDVRDLARFTLDLLERDVSGTFNVVSPPGRFSIGDLVSTSISCANSLARPSAPPRAIWVPASFMSQKKVSLEVDMPIWSDPAGADAAFAKTSVSRALAAGLSIRAIKDTVCDTLAWHLQRPAAERATLKAGIDAAHETDVLAAWRAAAGGLPR
jgi:2'-hydroxyisoflavone reductase